MMDNFDTEKFIIDIQNRPSIWDSSSADYSNRDLKKKCWEEIVDLYGGEGQTVEQKKDLGLVLQKRWKSIRSCYAREVKRQKNLKSGSGATNRKSEYIYFKQLQFLQKVVAIREKEDDEEENSESTEVRERPKEKATIKRKRQLAEDDDPFVRALNNSIEQRQRETSEQILRETAETDEDRLFLLSLLSTLKNLPVQVKMATKIKMLTLLNDASDYSGYRTFDYADRSFRHTSQANSGGRLVSQGNYHPGSSTQPRTTNYPTETITNSPGYNSMNTIMYTSSPSDTPDSLDSEPYMELFNTQNCSN
ncbi:unnamed protein product [Acanthoscelides obtectus]|uniref:MADF domain-containing protein n=2 Tax=Acanthoscelides obtectus TaxID=200917 RepID=A0A9P0PHW5_ACAOB|nr:unnamed protein product [Acanthoscelides obtectus]CAK1664618.1 hypothetical protein AOBTE_LOCUS24365 [Acanthoscelides obtectus]